MRRLDSNYYFEDLPTVTLYRQDVEEIIETMRGAGKRQVDIQSGEYEFDSLDELQRESGNSVDRLKLDVRLRELGQRTVKVTIEPYHVHIFGDDFEIGTRLARMIRQKSRRFGWFVRPAALAVSAVGGLAFVTFLSAQIPRAAEPGLIAPMLTGLVLCGTALLLPPRSRVVLVRRHEHQTFWKRHAGDFIKAGIGLGGGIIGYVIRMLQT